MQTRLQRTASRDPDKTIQVLFEISSAVNSTFNLDELYLAIHQSLGKILNVDNFYIAIHNKEKDSIFFPYLVDEKDHGFVEVFNISKKNSLTARVINEKKPLLIRENELRQMYAASNKEAIGSPSKVWVGVPLKVRQEVLGAFVLQSYTSEHMYTENDLELLSTVSQFIALAIERKQREEILKQNEKITTTLYAIANAVNTTDNLSDLYASIYYSLNGLIQLPNFFIALLDEERQNLHFPFYLDEYDTEDVISPILQNIFDTNYITTEVLRSKKPLFIDEETAKRKKAEGRIGGTMPLVWIGVPLIVRNEVIGVMTVQHYHDPEYFTQKDMDLLVAISDQVALAIDRKKFQEIIKEREKQIRQLSTQTEEFSLVAASIISIKDETQLFKDISKAIVEHSDYNRLIMSYFINDPPFRQIIGFEGIDPEEISRVREKHAPKEFFENIFRAGIKLGRFSCYLPHTANRVLGKELPIFSNRQKLDGRQAWHPEDMLFIRMNDAQGNFMGVISVDDSKSGMRPTNETVRPLEIFSSLISQIIIFRKIQNELKEHKENLENLVAGRTKELTTEISERIQIEKKLKKAKIDAEAASQAKGEFLANMSHEIRTPINGIMGMAELALEQVKENRDLKKLLTTIESEAGNLLRIINQILDFSKIEVGKLEIEKIPFDIRHTFEQACSTMAMGINDKGLDFISFLSPDIPNSLIGDPGRLRQVIVNLVSNALKFTHTGEIFIKAELVKDYLTGVELKFSIKDTGIGIPVEKQATIFDSFIQADGSTTRKYGGTGLGTTISKQLVELMGGKIGLESQEGKGSLFWFVLQFEKQKQKDENDSVQYGFEGKTVLVIDHNQTIIYVLAQYLLSYGLKVHTIQNATLSLSWLHESEKNDHLPDIILVSGQLPEMDGFELSRKIRSNSACAHIPIVLLISAGKPGDSRLCKDIGINGYLSKPVKREELKLAIQSVMEGTPLPDEQQVLITQHTIAEQFAKNKRILLVEDYPTNQQIAMRHLKNAGYNSDLAENGRIAVRLFKERSYDMVLMDIQMPEMDGYEATRQIREHEKILGALVGKSIRTPIIALTAHAMRGYEEKCLEADMDGYMTKPLKRDSFLAMIQKWISNTVSEKKEAEKQPENNGSNLHTQYAGKDYPLNYPKALNEFEGDEDFLKEVIAGFTENVDQKLPAIEAAIDINDYETVAKEAHAIKGGAANLCAMVVSAKAHDLELMGKQKELANAKDALSELNGAFIDLKAFIETMNR